MENIEEILNKIQSWRDEPKKRTVFCLFGEANDDESFNYNASVGGHQGILSRMVYEEMKRDYRIADAIVHAVKVYNEEQCK